MVFYHTSSSTSSDFNIVYSDTGSAAPDGWYFKREDEDCEGNMTFDGPYETESTCLARAAEWVGKRNS